eukprot:4587894-Lingulodinium_polyedra.AAC.1
MRTPLALLALVSKRDVEQTSHGVLEIAGQGSRGREREPGTPGLIPLVLGAGGQHVPLVED